MADGPVGDPVVSPAASHDGVYGERETVEVVRNALSEPPPTALRIDWRPTNDDVRYMQSGTAIALVHLLHIFFVQPGNVPQVLSERRCDCAPAYTWHRHGPRRAKRSHAVLRQVSTLPTRGLYGRVLVHLDGLERAPAHSRAVRGARLACGPYGPASRRRACGLRDTIGAMLMRRCWRSCRRSRAASTCRARS